jgi:hypothetical protein
MLCVANVERNKRCFPRVTGKRTQDCPRRTFTASSIEVLNYLQLIHILLSFEVSTAVTMKNGVFLGVNAVWL